MGNTRGSEWHRWDLHLHTASSYDAPYKGEDANELLCKTLHDNDIKAVAITDHFKIDKNRIEALRTIAPDIVFFPGVELRTDKGANNLHLIIIFSEKSNIETLSQDFDAIMRRTKAKSKDSDETIYWDFSDIVEFSNTHNGLISIHAGKKTNGLDKEISNALPVKEAIKAEIADTIDFFEVGKKKDIEDYCEHVFKVVKEKPIIMCSDCHDPRKYEPKENLWIKGELSFSTLQQCLFQPNERVFVGIIPPTLDRYNKNKQVNIDEISVRRIDTPSNISMNWFDFSIPLNTGLVAIIGNKGSGKSALSDIIGHLCKAKTMNKASFLNSDRFRRIPKNYASDYNASIKWADGHEDSLLLDVSEYSSTVEDAQYLPQKYIEEVCNDIGDTFQTEIDKVIFSYVDRSERGDATNLGELVSLRSKALEIEASQITDEIENINAAIIKIENKLTKEYAKEISDRLAKAKEMLERHESSKPVEVKKPAPKEANAQYTKDLETINANIAKLKEEIETGKNEISKMNNSILETTDFIAKIKALQLDFDELVEIEKKYIETHKMEYTGGELKLVTPIKTLEEYLSLLQGKKKAEQEKIDSPETGLTAALTKAEEEKEKLIANTDTEEKVFQKYLKDNNEWNEKKAQILGTPDVEDSLKYFEAENDYLQSKVSTEYEEIRQKRKNLLIKLYSVKTQKVSLYDAIYAPVEAEITTLLGNLEDTITFKAEIQLSENQFEEKVLDYINQKYSGYFKGTKESHTKMSQIVRSTDFENPDSVTEMIKKIMTVVDEDIDSSDKKISDKQQFYNYLYGLEYIGISFKLKLGGRSLTELSPGERGIVLLIFYLALSKNNMPIIIDQPEDNLDNQSVFSKLVPCICRAKQKRQVIIVTHNPNIAVACDAEQVIFCTMNKDESNIQYLSGAIENGEIKKHVVDVLEGTMPAFDLRRKKYI